MKIFVSYAWGSVVADKRPLQEKAITVVNSVRKAFPESEVWLDIEKMAADSCNKGMADAMVEAIDQAQLVIVCVSQDYHESKNCMAEYTYADGEKKSIVYVNVGAHGYVPKGTLKFRMGEALWANAWTPENWASDDGERVMLDQVRRAIDPVAALAAGIISPFGLSGGGGGELELAGKCVRKIEGVTAHTMAVLLDKEGGLAFGDSSFLSLIKPGTGELLKKTPLDVSMNGIAALSGGRIALAVEGKNIVWVMNESEILCAYEGHTKKVSCVAALPGDLVASGGGDKEIHIWRAATGEQVTKLRGQKNVFSLAVLPDGRLASGGDGGKLQLWDVSTGSSTAVLQHYDSVTSLAVLESGLLASNVSYSCLYLWNTSTHEVVGTMELNAVGAWNIASLRGGLLAIACVDGTVQIWDVASCKCVLVLQKSEKYAGVGRMGLAALPDGCLVSGSCFNTHVWKLAGLEGRPATAPSTTGPPCPTCHCATLEGTEMFGSPFNLCIFCKHVLPKP